MAKINLEAEAELDPTLQFQAPLAANAANPKRIFITGTTGFLGGYLLSDLLERSSAEFVCLLRGNTPDAARIRLQQKMDRYGLWRDEYADRIHPVIGDLSKPLLGLTEETFNTIAASIDLIVHNGGWVNFIYPYAKLKPTNVTGTHEVLRLADRIQTKPVHFISSLAVFFSKAHGDAERLYETDIPKYDGLKGGYKQSKWVSDRMLLNAQARGLPAAIYRPVRVTGDSRTGVTGDTNDLLNSLLKGCVLLDQNPTFDVSIPMVPVDYVSESIVHIALQPDSWGKAFHLIDPSPISWDDLTGALRSAGYPMTEMAYSDWLEELKRRAREAADKKQFYRILKLLLNAPHNLFFERPPFDTANLDAGLAGSGIECPPSDTKRIHTYIKFFQESGHFPMPELAVAA